jgi:hypothetical protein
MRDKKLREIEKIASTIRELAVPGLKPKLLIQSVKDRHPKASRKKIARGAFLSVILSAILIPADTQALHDLAIKTRDDDENPRVSGTWVARSERR